MKKTKTKIPKSFCKVISSLAQKFCLTLAYFLGTLDFLHEQYKEIIYRELNFKSSSVEIGGDPNIKSTIIGYLNLIYPNTPPADLERGSGKYPIFAFLYFCLRIGDYETAIGMSKIKLGK